MPDVSLGQITSSACRLIRTAKTPQRGLWLALWALAGCQIATKPSATEPAAAVGFLAERASRASQNDGAASGDLLAVADAGSADGGERPRPIQLGGPVPMFRGDAQHTGRSLYALPAKMPQERWRFATQGRVTAAPALAADGSVLFGSHDAFVYALAGDGALRWKYRTQDMVFSTPALRGDGSVYLGSDDDRLYSLQLTDGALRWSAHPGSCKRSSGRSPEGARCDIVHATLGPDGTLYLGGEAIYALNADGSVRWQFVPPTPKKVHCASAPSLGLDGTVYAACQEVVYALDPGGSKRWEFAAQGEIEASPAIGPDGAVHFGSDDRRLYALDASGVVRGSFLAAAPIRTAVAIGKTGNAVFGTDEGDIQAVRADSTLLWTFHTAGPVRSYPLLDSDESVLVGSQDDRLYAVAAMGVLKWSVAFDADVDGAPVLGPDGTIYVGADDMALHALR